MFCVKINQKLISTELYCGKGYSNKLRERSVSMADPKNIEELYATPVFEFEITIDDLIDFLPKNEQIVFETLPFEHKKSFLLKYLHGIAKGLESGLLGSFADVAKKIMVQLDLHKFLLEQKVTIQQNTETLEGTIKALNEDGTLDILLSKTSEQIKNVIPSDVTFLD